MAAAAWILDVPPPHSACCMPMTSAWKASVTVASSSRSWRRCGFHRVTEALQGSPLCVADGFRFQLRGLALTELALIEHYTRDHSIELDAPRLCSFINQGSIPGHFSLTSPVLNLASADIHFHDHWSYSDKDPNKLTVPMWNFLRHLHGVRVLKLQLDFYAEYITIETDADDGGSGGIPTMFPNLEYLKLDAHCKDDHDKLSVAYAEGCVNVYNSKRHMIHHARLMGMWRATAL
uniref:Uncharacterized protein n=1 Tax=Oryza punctata TaxID=4537 RepID=A0A0E0LTW0_ORYPU